MHVYPAAATIRPRSGRKTLVFRSIRPETGFLEIKAHRRVDMKEPETLLTPARSTATARATKTRAQAGATQGQVHRARYRHYLPAANLPRPPPHYRPSHHASGHNMHPTADAAEAVSRNTATRGAGGGARHGHHSPRLKKTSHYRFSLRSLKAGSEEPESEQHERRGRVSR